MFIMLIYRDNPFKLFYSFDLLIYFITNCDAFYFLFWGKHPKNLDYDFYFSFLFVNSLINNLVKRMWSYPYVNTRYKSAIVIIIIINIIIVITKLGIGRMRENAVQINVNETDEVWLKSLFKEMVKKRTNSKLWNGKHLRIIVLFEQIREFPSAQWLTWALELLFSEKNKQTNKQKHWHFKGKKLR